MSVQTVITITSNDSLTQNKEYFANGSSKFTFINRLQNYLNGLAGGARLASLDVQVSGGNSVAASGTVTFAAVVAGDTITINGVVFTCVASGATGNQFNVGGSDTLSAANAAAAINASTDPLISGIVSASPVGTVITISAVSTGKMGNCITLAGGAHVTASGARLAGGVDPTANVMSFL